MDNFQTELNYTPLQIEKTKLPFNVRKLIFFLIGLPMTVVMLFILCKPFFFNKQNITQPDSIKNKISISFSFLSSSSPTPVKTVTPTAASSPKKSPTPTTELINKPTPTTKLIKTPTPTLIPTIRVANPPQMNITYPSENQTITFTSPSQQFCVVDVPAGGGQTGLQRRQNINNAGWSSYQALSTLCFNPNEGQNTVNLQYKNSYGDESVQYYRQFTFHRQEPISVTLNGRIYADVNCNASWDSGETNISTSATVNIFKMPEFYILTTLNSNSDGSFSYSSTVNPGDSLQLQAGPVSPSGYTSNPKYIDPTITLNNDSRNYTVNIPQVPNENHSACQ